MLLVGVGFAAGRLTAPAPARAQVQPPVGGVRYEHGTPVGFSAQPKGAGDAAAWYLSVLSQRAGAPRERLRALLYRVSMPAQRRAVAAALLPPAATEGNGNIWQFTPLRAWAQYADRSELQPDGTRIAVELYGVALIGARTDGSIVADDAAAIGGFYLHRLLMQRHHGAWKLREVDPAVPAPAPLITGTLPDQHNGVDRQVLARVFGPDSWIPSMR